MVGGASDTGVIFSRGPDGGALRILHSFSALEWTGVNIDGASPIAGLTHSGDTLYGTTRDGGSFGSGTVFSVRLDGSDFRTLHHFGPYFGLSYENADGAEPSAGLLVSGRALYGTASLGGRFGYGTIFRLSLPPDNGEAVPPLTIRRSGRDVVLSWTAAEGQFELQESAGLSPAEGWSPVGQLPVVSGSRITVTVPIAYPHRFFRLVTP